jgi:type I restriction enzyme R subunit
MSQNETNFHFLERFDKRVAQLAKQAEEYVHTDPDSCMFKLRLMVETMAKKLTSLQMHGDISKDLGAMLGSLERNGVVPRRQADGMHAIRRDGNAAVHGSPTPVPTAMRRLREAYKISGWFCKIVKRGSKVKLDEFVPPHPPDPLTKETEDFHNKIDILEESIEERRIATRESLLMFGPQEDVQEVTARIIEELVALDNVAAAAGEPTIDADFVALVMAMDLEQIEEDPRHGRDSRKARREAEQQLDFIKKHLADRENEFLEERTFLMKQRDTMC